MIDWNDNAKAAVETFMEWLDVNDDGALELSPLTEKFMEEVVLNYNPTQKTVADAVEYYERAWPDEKDSVCVWDDKRKKFEFWISDYEPVSYCYEVCNYEQFEAYAVEQEGEKWTHTWGKGKCRVIATDESTDEAWVKFDLTGNSGIVSLSELKPIKPTISESRALELMKTMCPDEWAALDRKYNII